jgi:hypothetical protein
LGEGIVHGRRCRHRERIDCPLPTVAAYAFDRSNAPEWCGNISSVPWKSEPPVHAGSRVDFVARFLGRTPRSRCERLVMRTDEGPFPMGTTCTWTALDGNGTMMTLRNRGRPAGFSGHRGVVAVRVMPGPQAAFSWTQTSVSTGITPVAQIQSLAGTLTRTQPCDAKRPGTLFDPCTASPPSKYLGR